MFVVAAEGPGGGGCPWACEHSAQPVGWGVVESQDAAAVNAVDESRVSTNRLWGCRPTGACERTSTHPSVLLWAYWLVVNSCLFCSL